MKKPVSRELDVSLSVYMQISVFFSKIYFSSSLGLGGDEIYLMCHQLLCMLCIYANVTRICTHIHTYIHMDARILYPLLETPYAGIIDIKVEGQGENMYDRKAFIKKFFGLLEVFSSKLIFSLPHCYTVFTS